jgi:hypothetical protein
VYLVNPFEVTRTVKKALGEVDAVKVTSSGMVLTSCSQSNQEWYGVDIV